MREILCGCKRYKTALKKKFGASILCEKRQKESKKWFYYVLHPTKKPSEFIEQSAINHDFTNAILSNCQIFTVYQ